MNENIRKYVNDLFKNAPNTKRANDLKEEIISNAQDKYNDLKQNGKTEEEAYHKVIEEIGEVDELIEELNKNNPISKENYENGKKKSAFVVSVAVGFYIFSIIVCAILDELGLPDFVTGSSFLTLAGIPTCFLIYHFMSRPKYNKYEDTIVEEFKEWKGKKDNNKEVKKAISSVLWTLTVLIYLLISFISSAWHITWIIFIIATLIENIINLLFKLGE